MVRAGAGCGDRKAVSHDGWMLLSDAPGPEPAEPWPGQIEFALDRERSNFNPGEDWGTAVYVHVEAT